MSAAIIYLSILTFASTAFSQEIEGHHSWNRHVLTGGNLRGFRTVFFDRSYNKLYVGGINFLYEFDPTNVTRAPRMLMWRPEAMLERTCRTFKDDPILCQNNIRVFLPINATHLYACGTMAFLPLCTYVLKETFTRIESSIENGRWKTPRDPYVSTVSVFANQTLFTATRSSTHGNDAIISRALNGVTLRTKVDDRFWLNDPYFVSGIHVAYNQTLQDKVILFMREKAEEFQPYAYGMSSNPNDRNVVSRVASVCVNDHGGSAYVLNRRFASYMKKTIVCNAPGSTDDETSFQYTHLESTFEVPDEDGSGESTVYGIFTMPNDAISGSAVCAYRMSDIKREMSANKYWKRKATDGPSTSYTGDLASGPGTCVEESRRLTQTRLTFGKNHPIKFGTIYRSRGTPFYQEPGTKFTHVVVDKIDRDHSSINKDVTVLYMMTATGLLKRIAFTPTPGGLRNWTLPDIQPVTLGEKEAVLKMVVGDQHLYVVTNQTIVQVPLAACAVYESCDKCKQAVDPYCFVNEGGLCEAVTNRSPLEIRQIAKLSVSCPRREEVSAPNHDRLLIEELQSNLSTLRERNSQKDLALAEIRTREEEATSGRDACNARLIEQQEENSRLTDTLTEKQQELTSAKREYNDTLSQYEHCVYTRRFFMDHAVRMAVELRDRPTQADYNRETGRLRQARDRVLIELDRCRIEKGKITTKATNCTVSLVEANERLENANLSCREEMRTMKSDFDEQTQKLKKKLYEMHDVQLLARVQRNESEIVADKKLGLCLNETQILWYDNALLRKRGKVLARRMNKFLRTANRRTWLFRRYRSQHRCIDGGRWYVSNATGNLFMLVEDQASFDQAELTCRSMNASLAVFRNDQELRYITNLIRAFEPNSYYWIGLVKRSDGSMRWQDGSSVRKYKSRVSNQSRRFQNKTTYCAEVNGSNNWDLAPCTRRRKFICQRASVQATQQTQQTQTTTPKQIQ